MQRREKTWDVKLEVKKLGGKDLLLCGDVFEKIYVMEFGTSDGSFALQITVCGLLILLHET